ncbi:endonuclease III [Candidatus Microgenomates bacterium]|nr:MAG: endonuclease III [Candidatus Microgenomates bacterium]
MDKYQKVFQVFSKCYKLVPLEVFGDDAYKTLVSTLMSSRTNDDTTLVCANKLFDKAPNIRALSRLSEKKISELIYPVGFYKTKARHLKRLAEILITKYEARVPSTQKVLVKLPGVGPKTANLVLNRAFGIPAIAVDTHVHRIANMLGWINTKTPEESERALVKTLPKKYWADTNRLFVSIGRQYRTAQQLQMFLAANNLLGHPN